MIADAIDTEAAAIAQEIEARKSLPYQAADKALVADYLASNGIAGPRSWEITPAPLIYPTLSGRLFGRLISKPLATGEEGLVNPLVKLFVNLNKST